MALLADGLSCDLDPSSLLSSFADIIASMFERRKVALKFLMQVAAAVLTPLTPLFLRSLHHFLRTTLPLLLLISLWLVFVPDNQKCLLSGWLTAPGWLENC